MYQSFNCLFHRPQSDFLNALKKSIIISHNHVSPQQALACTTFEGNKLSFEIACGNLTANQKLIDYGMQGILGILKGLCELFDELNIKRASSITILHYGHVILILTNESISNSQPTLSLDIADLLDMVGCDLIGDDLDDVIEKANKQRSRKDWTRKTNTDSNSSIDNDPDGNSPNLLELKSNEMALSNGLLAISFIIAAIVIFLPLNRSDSAI